MIEFESSVQINRPLREVFAFVANQENNPKWNYFVTSVKKTSEGPFDAGTTFHQVRKTDPQELQIAVIEPNRLIRIETIPPSTPEVNRLISFREENGNTVLVDHWKLDTGHPQFLQRLGAGRVKAAVKENLAKLKELLESGSATLQDGRRVDL